MIQSRNRTPGPSTSDAVVSDTDKLGDALDRILLSDPSLRRIHRQIVRRQRVLRTAATDEQWHLYMSIEELFND